METNFNHEQSLALINEMIQRARNNVTKKGTYTMIFWGYLVAAVAIVNCVLLHTLTDPNRSFWVWMSMIPGGVVSYFIERQVYREALVKTHIDRIGSTVWRGFTISVAVFLIAIYTAAFKYELFLILMLITPVILTMVGTGQFATACIFRYKTGYAIAALFWAGAIISAFSGLDVQYIILAVCMILGFVVPGHLLNHQAKNSHV